MENWGLVTYRTTAVLFDERTSDARFKSRIAYVIAHGETLRNTDLGFGDGTCRTCASVVRQSGDDGLVERAMA